MRKTLFADILLPLPLPGYYTYRIPYDLNELVQVGQHVAVQFGKHKIYSGIIRKIHAQPPENFVPKYILSIIDQLPVVHEKNLQFWEWIASYYLCYPGEVMHAALPSGLRLASESRIALHPGFDSAVENLSEKELLIVQALISQGKLTIREISHIIEVQKVIPIIKTLIEKSVIVTEEALESYLQPAMESFVRLSGVLEQDEAQLGKVFEKLGKRAPRQLELLMSWIHLHRNINSGKKEIKKSELLESVKANPTVLKELEKKGILECYEKEASMLDLGNAEKDPESIELTSHQQEAIDRIKVELESKEVVLLHGVTSSGKTEIYIKLIEEVISQGRQVLYLLPEIALTSQVIGRLAKYFGNKITVYHSKYNERERAEAWFRTMGKSLPGLPDCQIVLGARSALFLPFHDLGLIIVDEEHDPSYKQYDPAPRYNARDAAIYLAYSSKARVILGSATPSAESYLNVKIGKYGLAELNERYGGLQMPEILLADLKEERKNKSMRSNFSSTLLKHFEQGIANKEQIILFQNRRGFSLHLECDVCHWIPYCRDCDISLTYHKSRNKLVCHYCGYTIPVPEQCPQCNSTRILMKGFGTEKIEEDIKLMYPELRVERMDLDTTRTRFAHQRILEAFSKREIDVLVGTQMVTKGLDFDHVSLVGIMNADGMINFPDFRSHERSYQLMEQVSGRAGRKFKRGIVVIQTHNTNHPVIQHVVNHDYHSMMEILLEERRKYHYPPYYRLILVKLKHSDNKILDQAANTLARDLKHTFGNKILGPEYPLVSRISNQYIKHILLKIERTAKLQDEKETLANILREFSKNKEFNKVRVIVDVDPQ